MLFAQLAGRGEVAKPMMRPDVEFVLDHLAEVEGGEANIPGDSGGQTFYGISQYARKEYESMGLPWPPTEKTARVFFGVWLEQSGLPNLPLSDRLAAQLFLFRVHKNEEMMARLLQVSLTLAGEPVKIDGMIGPRTAKALVFADEAKLYDSFVAVAAGWYSGASTWQRFGETFLSHRLRLEVQR